MQVIPGIFKSYVIRGVYGTELFNETAVAVGKAFAKILAPAQVVVGRDARVSSPALHGKIIEGLTASGVNVIDIGVVPTPLVYFGAFHLETSNAVMLTGSHNPPEYNGFKISVGDNYFVIIFLFVFFYHHFANRPNII